jgi:hypothetical protein
MRDEAPESILKACDEAMHAWSAGAPAADDRTAIILKRLG